MGFYEENFLDDDIPDWADFTKKRYTDSVPENWSLKRVQRPDSEWDETKWRKSRFGDDVRLLIFKASSRS